MLCSTRMRQGNSTHRRNGLLLLFENLEGFVLPMMMNVRCRRDEVDRGRVLPEGEGICPGSGTVLSLKLSPILLSSIIDRLPER
jgi:hypothetical protein